MNTKQLTNIQIARGTKLTTDHLWRPLTSASNVVEAGTLQTALTVPGTLTWQMPALDSNFFENPYFRSVYMPFLLPPLQDEWVDSKSGFINASSNIKSVTISFDQRAEAFAIIDAFNGISGSACTGEPWGLSTNQQDRYNITITLLEKQPTILGGSTWEHQSLLNFTIPGQDAFGNKFFRQNPFYLDGLNITIEPWKTYTWKIDVAELATALPVTHSRLALPAFTLECDFERSAVRRDTENVQNAPANIAPKTGSLGLISPPAANALINGKTDIQASFKPFDRLLEKRLEGGQLSTKGFECEHPLWEQVGANAGYSAIIVPLFPGYHTVQSSMVDSGTLPYTSRFVSNPSGTADRRIMPIPNGFVVHDVYAVWSLNSPWCTGTSPTSSGTIGAPTFGTVPSAATFLNSVGVSVRSACGSDNDASTQVAYGSWGGGTAYLSSSIDTFWTEPQPTVSTQRQYSIQQIPLVYSGTADTTKSYYGNGSPFYMGAANSLNRTRTNVGSTSGVSSQPPTSGSENVLEVRWVIEDAVNGLNNPSHQSNIVLGAGGNSVIIIGKMPIDVGRS